MVEVEFATKFATPWIERIEPGVVVPTPKRWEVSTVKATVPPPVPSWKAPWERRAIASASSPEVKKVLPPEPVCVKPK